MSRTDPATTLTWMREGTEVLLGAVATLPDLDRPSVLPGWTCAHLVGHLARNAEAIGRLAAWARTGVETPMYASAKQRDADISAAAALPDNLLRAELRSTAAELDDALSNLAAQEWQAWVRTAQGRVIPATEVPWMRVREVWLHTVDLNAGTQVYDIPGDVVDALLDDATELLSTREDCPTVTLRASETNRAWSLAGGGSDVVTGPAADLLGWITGRPHRLPLALPALPRWL